MSGLPGDLQPPRRMNYDKKKKEILIRIIIVIVMIINIESIKLQQL